MNKHGLCQLHAKLNSEQTRKLICFHLLMLKIKLGTIEEYAQLNTQKTDHRSSSSLRYLLTLHTLGFCKSNLLSICRTRCISCWLSYKSISCSSTSMLKKVHKVSFIFFAFNKYLICLKSIIRSKCYKTYWRSLAF